MPFLPSSPIRFYRPRERQGGTTQVSGVHAKGSTKTSAINTSSIPQDIGCLELHSAKRVSQSDFRVSSTCKERASSALSVATRRSSLDSPIFTASPGMPASSNAPLHREMNDNMSESEYSQAEEVQPVIVGRASSVRIGRPRIIEFASKHTAPAGLVGSNSAWMDDPDPRDHSWNAENEVIRHVEVLPTMYEQGSPRHSEGDDVNLPESLTRHAGKIDDQKHDLSATAHQQNPTSSTGAVEDSQEPPSPTLARSTHDAAIAPDRNGLRGGLNRTMSSPLPGKPLTRRVTIRPADLITRNHTQTDSFRENVVTTPYPARISFHDDGMQDIIDDALSRQEKHIVGKPDRAKVVSFGASSGSKDRFPSPEPSEVLFLHLGVSKHPGIHTTIEIQVASRADFDDEMLFEQIRTAYLKQLLGKSRAPFTLLRCVSHVTVSPRLHDRGHGFNSSEFIQRLENPRLGHRRKKWITWLRKHNSRKAAPTRLSDLTHHNDHTPIRKIDDLSRLSLRTKGIEHSRRSSWTKVNSLDKNGAEPNKRFSTASEASSFNFVYSPAMPRLPFFASRQDHSPELADGVNGSPCRSFFWPSSFSTSPATGSSRGEETETEVATVSLHYRYRMWTVAAMTLFVILTAILAATIWIIFGVPGTRPGTSPATITVLGEEIPLPVPGWRDDAQHRVVTGVVIGIVCLLVGCISEVALLWSSAQML